MFSVLDLPRLQRYTDTEASLPLRSVVGCGALECCCRCTLLCDIALVERLNYLRMNTLPWHELQAWCSDDAKNDWEENRSYVQGSLQNVCVVRVC